MKDRFKNLTFPRPTRDPTNTRTIRSEYSELIEKIVVATGKMLRIDFFNKLRASTGLSALPNVILQSEEFEEGRGKRFRKFLRGAAGKVRRLVRKGLNAGASRARSRMIKMGVSESIEGLGKDLLTKSFMQTYESINLDKIKHVQNSIRNDLRLFLAQLNEGALIVDQRTGRARAPTKTEIDNRITEILRINVRKAKLIAATETVRGHSVGSMKIFKDQGIDSWRWNASTEIFKHKGALTARQKGSTCNFCYSLHGKIVKIGEPFAQGPSRKPEPVIHPPAHPNCFCSVEPVLEGISIPITGPASWKVLGTGRATPVRPGIKVWKEPEQTGRRTRVS